MLFVNSPFKLGCRQSRKVCYYTASLYEEKQFSSSVVNGENRAWLTHVVTLAHLLYESLWAYFFLFSCMGHKFIFCRGRPEKSTPRRFLVFSRISNGGLRWPLQPCNLNSQRRASHLWPCFTLKLSSRLRSTKDGLLIVALVWKSPKCQLCKGSKK